MPQPIKSQTKTASERLELPSIRARSASRPWQSSMLQKNKTLQLIEFSRFQAYGFGLVNSFVLRRTVDWTAGPFNKDSR